MRRKLTKIISATSITLLLLMQVGSAWALTVPSAPSAPSTPPAPENQTQPPAPPPAPEAPQSPVPEAPPAPSLGAGSSDGTQTDSSQPAGTNQGDGGYSRGDRSSNQSGDNSSGGNTGSPNSNVDNAGQTAQTSGSSGNQTGNQNGNGNLGDTTINSGNAANTAAITTSANTSAASGGSATASQPGGIKVKNSDNGSGSTNTGSVNVSDGSTTVQDNNAKVSNNLTQDTNTGNNSASRNTGGNSTINTGNANTTGTIITAVNTNIDGVAVAEFNVADDQVGDIILDFGTNCIAGGCGGVGSLSAINTGNGADSVNNALIDQTTTDATFQTNDATIENGMVLGSNTGNNQADRNTGGDSAITTGDANTSANVLTFANNNLSGEVYYFVVNIFGDLVGDIIFPEELLAYGVTGTGGITAANTGNGSGSQNTTNITLNSTDSTSQTNVADIQNNLNLSATTGGNSTSRNTNGSSSIETGDSSVLAQVLNVVNSNLSGGTWWLVIINEAGNWIGKLFGAPDGANYAGSAGTEFTVNSAGEITAVNAGNGSGSTNNSSISQTNDNTTVQTNNATIVNNLDLSANTGGNSASRNTGGDSSITTGNANIIANLVNFVNNNIVGGGKLFVSVVNVFGSWIGDFLPPGTSKPKPSSQDVAAAGVGGWTEEHNSQSSSGNNDEDSGNSEEEEDTSPAEGTGLLLAEAASTYAGGFPIRVAGAISFADSQDQQTPEEQTTGKKVIDINLAWLLALIPVLLIAKVIKGKLVLTGK